MEQRVWASDFSDPFAVDEASTLRADVTCAPITGNEEVPFDREKEVVSVDMEALLDLTWVEYQDRLPNRMDQWGQRIQIHGWIPSSSPRQWTPSRV